MIHLAAIPFSGASVNPARTFRPGLIGGEWEDAWIYYVAPLLGAVLRLAGARRHRQGPDLVLGRHPAPQARGNLGIGFHRAPPA